MNKEYYKQFPIVDTHDFSYRGTPKEKRKKLNIGNIYTNAAECKKCGYYIRSRNKHDMVTCKCGAISIDGGSWYCKTRGKEEDMIMHLEVYDDVKDNA